jgi:glycosyltransferase involved in cell wall biosynthesis
MSQVVLPSGGSEIGLKYLKKYVDFSGVNLILSSCNYEFLDLTKPNILWQQLSYDQENVARMRDTNFTDRIHTFVYNSHWTYEKFRAVFNTPAHKSVVIKNGIEPFPKYEKPKGKLKLVYTSTPWRGLDVLLRAFYLLNRDDVELDVYSSTIIYGTGFYNQTQKQWEPLFDVARNMRGVNYMGYATNDQIREALQNAHILAYPSTFEETSCYAVIEAMAAGCQVVTTNLGALYDTCGEYGILVPYDSDRERLARRYADALNSAIDSYWETHTQTRLAQQAEFYNREWSWGKRSQEWKILLETINL